VRQLGISTGCYYQADVVTEDAVTCIAATGANLVEVYVQGEAELDRDVRHRIVTRCASLDLDVVAVHPYVFGWEHLLLSPYTRHRTWARRRFVEYLTLCVELHAPAWVGHGPPAHHVRTVDGGLEPRYVDSMAELARDAQARGVLLCVENVSYGLLRTPADVREHVTQLPEVGLVIDTKSAWKAGHRPVEFLAHDLLPSVHHTQVSFRSGGVYGLPAQQGAPVDNDLVDTVRLPVPHVIEIEARDPQDVVRSYEALQALPATGT
jgi:sugar phosphate isomerase/epimerase